MITYPAFNQILFKAVSPGASTSGAKIDIAYVEFSTAGAVAPEATPADMRAYLDSLPGTRDYLRVPIMSHQLGETKDGSPQLTMLIAVDGETGVLGRAFSAGSFVYAVTLAASQHSDQDIFAARYWYPVAEQLEKPAAGSITLSVSLS